MGNRLAVDKNQLQNIRKQAEESNPAHLFLQCIASRCVVEDDSEELELAEKENVVRGAGKYVRPSDSPNS